MSARASYASRGAARCLVQLHAVHCYSLSVAVLVSFPLSFSLTAKVLAFPAHDGIFFSSRHFQFARPACILPFAPTLLFMFTFVALYFRSTSLPRHCSLPHAIYFISRYAEVASSQMLNVLDTAGWRSLTQLGGTARPRRQPSRDSGLCTSSACRAQTLTSRPHKVPPGRF